MGHGKGVWPSECTTKQARKPHHISNRQVDSTAAAPRCLDDYQDRLEVRASRARISRQSESTDYRMRFRSFFGDTPRSDSGKRAHASAQHNLGLCHLESKIKHLIFKHHRSGQTHSRIVAYGIVIVLVHQGSWLDAVKAFAFNSPTSSFNINL